MTMPETDLTMGNLVSNSPTSFVIAAAVFATLKLVSVTSPRVVCVVTISGGGDAPDPVVMAVDPPLGVLVGIADPEIVAAIPVALSAGAPAVTLVGRC